MQLRAHEITNLDVSPLADPGGPIATAFMSAPELGLSGEFAVELAKKCDAVGEAKLGAGGGT